MSRQNSVPEGLRAPHDRARGERVPGIDPAFWSGRRVFLTGHTGFKGSWLSIWLQTLGAELTGYALAPPTVPNLYEQGAVAANLRSIVADVRDYKRLAEAVAACQPEVVIHMAAQSVVKRGYADPIETYSTNVMGTVNLLQAVRGLTSGCVVVNVTSDKCYAHRSSGPGYREDDPMGGDDPYSNSKGCAELVGSAFHRSYFSPQEFANHRVALASARAGNAVGGGDWTADQLIPDLMRAFAAGQPCRIRSPAAIRPWQFVLEPLRGYLMLAERLAKEGPVVAAAWNFGPPDHDAKPVLFIADRLVAGWGGGAEWVVDRESHPPESAVLRLDASRAAAGLGWRSALGLEATLAWIVEWYRCWHEGGDLAAATRHQIEHYEELLMPQQPASVIEGGLTL